ncbi:twin-arginine translocation signal domain-containing protein [Micromonospora matsumotoense]|uniref:twin-arginine translocation signal domain-containing protein n=1 Tax=Micromonospora matsumotoense TaxID=121616 RepID=UPI0033E930F8
MRRRNFLRLSAAGAASMGAASLLGPWQAQADTIGPLRAAPTTPFAVGVRQYNWTHGNHLRVLPLHRPIRQRPHHQRTGRPGRLPRLPVHARQWRQPTGRPGTHPTDGSGRLHRPGPRLHQGQRR